jgi:hypothetical protein
MALALDTLAYARRLQEAGFSEQQAQGQAEALAAAMTDTLATKQDLRELAAATKQDVRELAAATKQDVRELAASIRDLAAATNARFEALERHFDLRLDELEKRFEIRIGAIQRDMDTRMATRADLIDLERRMTMRLGGIMVAGIGIFSALTRLG